MNSNTKNLIQRYYDYFNQQDIPSFLSLLDNHVIHDINQGETQKGIDAFARFMENWLKQVKQ